MTAAERLHAQLGAIDAQTNYRRIHARSRRWLSKRRDRRLEGRDQLNPLGVRMFERAAFAAYMEARDGGALTPVREALR